MKKLSVILIIFYFIQLPSMAKCSSDTDLMLLKKVSKNKKLQNAVELIQKSPITEPYESIIGKNPKNKEIKIQFKKPSSLSKSYTNFDAVGWEKKNNLYIYLNPKHKDAPVEALSSLIAHMTYHQDPIDSINEETYIWALEAVMWDYFLHKKPELFISKTDLVKRENEIYKLYKKSPKDLKYLKKKIKKLDAYKNLEKESPGFSDKELEAKLEKLLSM